MTKDWKVVEYVAEGLVVVLIIIFINELTLQMQTRLSCIRDLEKESRHKKAQSVSQKKADPEERYVFD